VGDFDGDTVPDLVTANVGSGDVGVLLGNGDGTFQAAVSFAVGVIPRSVTVADFDGDTAPDLVTANSGSDNVSVLLGNGDGTFQAAVSCGVIAGAQSVAASDLDGDTVPDLVIAKGTVVVLLPEPASCLMLIAGAVLLNMFHRRRVR
jgi:hypothetical protein